MTMIIDSLAAYRLTRLIVEDEILAAPRDAVLDFLDRPGAGRLASKASQLLECHWCVSIWVGAGVVVARRQTRWWAPVAEGLAVAAVVGIISDRG